MFRSSKSSAIERRIAEIEKEKALLRQNMKAVKRGGTPAVADRPHTPVPVDNSSEVQSPQPVAVPAQPPEKAEANTSGELFAWQRPSQPPPAAPTRVTHHREMPDRETSEKLANYLSSGSFFSTVPTHTKPSVQRNKAIFMVIVVIVVGYVIYRLSRGV